MFTQVAENKMVNRDCCWAMHGGLPELQQGSEGASKLPMNGLSTSEICLANVVECAETQVSS